MNFSLNVAPHWHEKESDLQVQKWMSDICIEHIYVWGQESHFVPHVFSFHSEFPSCYKLLCYIARTMTFIFNPAR